MSYVSRTVFDYIEYRSRATLLANPAEAPGRPGCAPEGER